MTTVSQSQSETIGDVLDQYDLEGLFLKLLRERRNEVLENRPPQPPAWDPQMHDQRFHAFCALRREFGAIRLRDVTLAIAHALREQLWQHFAHEPEDYRIRLYVDVLTRAGKVRPALWDEIDEYHLQSLQPHRLAALVAMFKRVLCATKRLLRITTGQEP